MCVCVFGPTIGYELYNNVISPPRVPRNPTTGMPSHSCFILYVLADEQEAPIDVAGQDGSGGSEDEATVVKLLLSKQSQSAAQSSAASAAAAAAKVALALENSSSAK